MSKLELHGRQSHEALCPSTTVSCSHVSNGCPWTGPRFELASSHLPTCKYEAIKGFFDVFAEKTQTLLDSNTLLKRKVEVLEGMVNALSVENEEVKRALGPWYKPQDNSPFASTSRYTTEMVSGRSNRLSTSLHRQSRGESIPVDTTPSLSASGTPVNGGGSVGVHISVPSSTSSGSRPADAEDIAAYFPPAETEGFIPNESEVWEHGDEVLFSPAFTAGTADPPTADHLRSPSSGQPHLYYDPYIHGHPSTSLYTPPPGAGQGPPSSSNSPPHVPTVAPLNISTSLHRTLLFLRESIVTLSSAVESLTRRQDVTLATEAMRTNEEIRSLRVVIHGLRMQVSCSTYDRPRCCGRECGFGGSVVFVS